MPNITGANADGGVETDGAAKPADDAATNVEGCDPLVRYSGAKLSLAAFSAQASATNNVHNVQCAIYNVHSDCVNNVLRLTMYCVEQCTQSCG